MARARNIKPGFFVNDELAELDPFARLLFIGLWTVADRDGRLEDRPKKIKAEILPYDPVDVDALLTALHSAGFIVRYRVDDAAFIHIRNFGKHQNPHPNEKSSGFPDVPDDSRSLTKKHDSSVSDRDDSLLLNDDCGEMIDDSAAHENVAEQSPKPEKPKAKRKTQLPDDFLVTDAMYAYGEKRGMDARQVDEETERFVLYHRSKGSLFVDWDAAWQGWIRRAPEFKRNITPFQARPADAKPSDLPIEQQQRDVWTEHLLREVKRIKRERANAQEEMVIFMYDQQLAEVEAELTARGVALTEVA